MDFHYLRPLYRSHIQHQHGQHLNWTSYGSHLNIWQDPANIQAIFHYAYKYAIKPVRDFSVWKYLKKGMRVLENGCSMAPMYKTYRMFFNHIPLDWILADIPNFSFHYACYIYARDDGVQFDVITEDLFDDPLKKVDGQFDLIIIQEVFEHLHSPRHMAEYMIDRLKVGGMLYSDYARSEGLGYDTPQSVMQRKQALEFLRSHLKFIFGDFRIDGKTLETCIGVKI